MSTSAAAKPKSVALEMSSPNPPKRDSGESSNASAVSTTSSQGSVIEEKHCMQKFIINHDNNYRQYWDILIAFVLIYLALFLPFIFAFVPDPPVFFDYWDPTVDAIFYVDIPINFITTYADEEGSTVTDCNKIMSHYLTGWFTIDLVSTFPWDIVTASKAAGLANLIKILRMLKFMKMVRMSKLARMIPKLQANLEISNASLTIVKFMIFIFLTAHWLGCFYFLIARWGDFGENSWPSVYICPHLKDGYVDECSSVSKNYLASLYWAITTMSTIGYGDIIPQSDSERVFVAFSMCMGAGIFAYGLTNMCTLVFNLNEREIRFNSLQDNMQQYLLEKKAPGPFKKKIKQFLFFKQVRSSIDSFSSGDDILSHLSPHLRAIIRLYFFDSLGLSIPLYNGAWPDYPKDRLVHRMTELLKGVTYPPNELVITHNMQIVDLHMITIGEVVFQSNFHRVGGVNGLVFDKDHDYDEVFHMIPKRQQKPSLPKMRSSNVNSMRRPSSMSMRALGIDKFDRKTMKGVYQFDLEPGCTFGSVSAVLGTPSTFDAYTLSSCDFYKLSQKDIMALFADSEFPQFRSVAAYRVLTHWKEHGRDFELPPGLELVDVMREESQPKCDMQPVIGMQVEEAVHEQNFVGKDGKVDEALRKKAEAKAKVRNNTMKPTSYVESILPAVARSTAGRAERKKQHAVLRKVGLALHIDYNPDDKGYITEQDEVSDDSDNDGEYERKRKKPAKPSDAKLMKAALRASEVKIARLQAQLADLSTSMASTAKLMNKVLAKANEGNAIDNVVEVEDIKPKVKAQPETGMNGHTADAEWESNASNDSEEAETQLKVSFIRDDADDEKNADDVKTEVDEKTTETSVKAADGLSAEAAP